MPDRFVATWQLPWLLTWCTPLILLENAKAEIDRFFDPSEIFTYQKSPTSFSPNNPPLSLSTQLADNLAH